MKLVTGFLLSFFFLLCHLNCLSLIVGIAPLSCVSYLTHLRRLVTQELWKYVNGWKKASCFVFSFLFWELIHVILSIIVEKLFPESITFFQVHDGKRTLLHGWQKQAHSPTSTKKKSPLHYIINGSLYLHWTLALDVNHRVQNCLTQRSATWVTHATIGTWKLNQRKCQSGLSSAC